MKNELSRTMQDAVAYAIEHGGKLKRFPGGFWCGGDLAARSWPWFGTATVEALVKRGAMAYTDWIVGTRTRFPVEATVNVPASDEGGTTTTG